VEYEERAKLGAHHPRAGSTGAPLLNPRRLGRTISLLRRLAPTWKAPVMALIAAEQRDPFKVLIGCILSLRTKDQTTAQASARLFALAGEPAALAACELGTIERAIYPVGFYRTKARAIRDLSADLLARFDGQVPDRIELLLTLKGVGRKTANLVVTQAFGKPGICVDTHVHRISNRWGLVRTKTPEQTEAALRRTLPRRYWLEFNELLVAFGQTICQPVSPRCSQCPISQDCPALGVSRRR